MRNRQVFIEHLHVEADAFLGGEGIHVAADRIDLAGNVLGRAMFGSFEDHVLDEMGDAIPLRVFVARTGLDPDSDRNRANVLHLLGNDGSPLGRTSRLILRTSSTMLFTKTLSPDPGGSSVLLHTREKMRKTKLKLVFSIAYVKKSEWTRCFSRNPLE